MVFLALVLALAVAPRAAGQGGANIGGVVTDENQAALPGVTITLVNTNNGATQVLLTGAEGDYRAVNLQPGLYSITAELTGFAATKRTIVLLVGANATINLTLGVATLSENVIVSGESPLVEVAKAQPQSVIVGEQLAVLPVLDRNFLVLAQLLPGGAAHRREQPVRGDQVRRARRSAQRLHDDRWRRHRRLDLGSPVINMTQYAVQEFKVFRNQFDAQYGAALNAVVNVVTKSGGNSPSGTGYYFGTRQGPQRPQRQGRHRAALQPVPHRRHLRRSHRAHLLRHVRRLRVLTIYKAAIVAAGQQSVCDRAERQLPVQLH